NKECDQCELDAGAVERHPFAQKCTQGAARNPIDLVECRNAEIEFLFVLLVVGSWAAGEQRIDFVGQAKNQIAFSPASATKLAQQRQTVEQVSGVKNEHGHRDLH